MLRAVRVTLRRRQRRQRCVRCRCARLCCGRAVLRSSQRSGPSLRLCCECRRLVSRALRLRQLALQRLHVRTQRRALSLRRLEESTEKGEPKARAQAVRRERDAPAAWRARRCAPAAAPGSAPPPAPRAPGRRRERTPASAQRKAMPQQRRVCVPVRAPPAPRRRPAAAAGRARPGWSATPRWPCGAGDRTERKRGGGGSARLRNQAKRLRHAPRVRAAPRASTGCRRARRRPAQRVTWQRCRGARQVKRRLGSRQQPRPALPRSRHRQAVPPARRGATPAATPPPSAPQNRAWTAWCEMARR